MATTMNIDAFAQGLRVKRQKIRAAARPAAQAATEHCYSLARVFVPVSEDGHYFYGSAAKAAPAGSKRAAAYYFAPGTLRDAIYQVYSKDNSSDGRATYHLSWNHRKAPYGFMVHNGTSRAPAHPFITRAMNAGKADALAIMKAEFVARVQE